MPDPNEPLPDGGRVFTGQLIGQLEPITLPTLDASNYSVAQRAASDAIRLLLGATGDNVDFHMVYRDGPNAPVLRSRWRVQAVAGGPALRPFTAGAYTTTVNYNLRIWPYSERLQVVFGQNEPTNWTYRGQMAPIIPALLLRQLWATVPGTVDADGARVISVGSLGTVRFTPSQMQFDRMYDDQVSETVPWNFVDDAQTNLVAAYRFAWPQNQERVPGLWLVTAGAEPYARKVSYLVNTLDLYWPARWDDPNEAAPDFTPVPWPAEGDEEWESLTTWPASTAQIDDGADVPLE